MMLIAVVFGGQPTLLLIKSILNNGDINFETFVFTVIITYLFLQGLNQFFTRTVTEFDGNRFYYRHKSLFGSKAWDEPLSKYKGVLARSEYHSGSKNCSSYTLYIVELLHPDKQRRIRLYQSRWSCSHRAIWKAYSRQLALPALWQDAEKEEYTQYDTKDLGKSVRELAAEGKLDISFNPVATVPESLQLNIQGDQLEVEISNFKIPLKMLPLAILMPLGLPAIFIWIGGYVTIVGVLIVAFFAGALIWASITTTLVRIKREGLHILSRTPWGETQGKRIRADTIENVRVGKTREDMTGQSQISRAVVVETAAGDYTIGQDIDEDALEWLKNCILSVVAK
ncbi:hypothetical protein [Candidatus Electronema sp. JM]|uniref:hypothetical protein n=1 Tax=Candidatus Electronema sp. JM TaxID=3401571 RepID=UPI003AA96919